MRHSRSWTLIAVALVCLAGPGPSSAAQPLKVAAFRKGNTLPGATFDLTGTDVGRIHVANVFGTTTCDVDL
jgi:hypothetical protein